MEINREKLKEYAPHLSTLSVAIVILITFSIPLLLNISGDMLESSLIWMVVAYISFAIFRKKIFSLGALGSAIGVFIGFLIAISVLSFFAMMTRCHGAGCENYSIPLWRELFVVIASFTSVLLLSFYFGKWGKMREDRKISAKNVSSKMDIWLILAFFSFLGYFIYNGFIRSFTISFLGFLAFVYEYSLFHPLYEKSDSFKHFNFASFVIVLAISYLFLAPLLLWDISWAPPLWLYLIFYSLVSIIPFLIAFGLFALLHLRKRQYKSSQEEMK